MLSPVLIILALILLVLSRRISRSGPDPAWSRLVHHVSGARGRRRHRGQVFVRVDRRLVRARLMASVERRLHQAGVNLTVSGALLALAAGCALLAVAAGRVGGLAAAALVVCICPPAAWWALAGARDRRIRRLDRDLPAALDLLVGQLRAHRSVVEAIVETAPRAPAFLRAELSRVAEELRLGVPLERALDALRKRVPSQALGTMVTAVLVADRSGGNLAEFLARQSRTVRAQVAFLQEVRALTAHGRSTAAILGLLPVGVAMALYVLSPEFFTPMVTTGPGRALLACAAGMEAAGWYVIRSMVRSVAR